MTKCLTVDSASLWYDLVDFLTIRGVIHLADGRPLNKWLDHCRDDSTGLCPTADIALQLACCRPWTQWSTTLLLLTLLSDSWVSISLIKYGL